MKNLVNDQKTDNNETPVLDKMGWSLGEIMIGECLQQDKKGFLFVTKDGQQFRTPHATGLKITPGMVIRFECVQAAKDMTETEDGTPELMKIDELETTDEGFFQS